LTSIADGIPLEGLVIASLSTGGTGFFGDSFAAHADDLVPLGFGVHNFPSGSAIGRKEILRSYPAKNSRLYRLKKSGLKSLFHQDAKYLVQSELYVSAKLGNKYFLLFPEPNSIDHHCLWK
jgi:hypothetical protein